MKRENQGLIKQKIKIKVTFLIKAGQAGHSSMFPDAVRSMSPVHLGVWQP